MTATAVSVCTRRRTWTAVQLAGFLVLAVAGALSFFPGRATAAGPAVTIPTGNPTDGQSISISGTGFPSRSADPTGLQIIECSDPGGTAAGLPIDATECEATVQKSVFQDNTGSFSSTYTIVALNPGNSSIQCDSTHFCVLWVGVDYNTAFTINSAFSSAFEIQGSTTTTTTTPSSTTTTTPTSTTTTSTPSTTTTTSSTTTTTSSSTTTTSSSSTTTTTPSSTTSSSTSTTTLATTSTTGTGDTTTTAPANGGVGGTDAGSGSSGTGASGTVSASSGSLAFTGGPTALPWLIGVGVAFTVVGALGRRLIPRTAP